MDKGPPCRVLDSLPFNIYSLQEAGPGRQVALSLIWPWLTLLCASVPEPPIFVALELPSQIHYSLWVKLIKLLKNQDSWQQQDKIWQPFHKRELSFQLTTGGHLASTSEKSAELPRPVDHGSVNDIRCEVILPPMNPSVVKQDGWTVPIICSVLHSHV